MSAAAALEGPWCGALSCHDPAEVVIDHPNGERTVCREHVGDYEVIRTDV